MYVCKTYLWSFTVDVCTRPQERGSQLGLCLLSVFLFTPNEHKDQHCHLHFPHEQQFPITQSLIPYSSHLTQQHRHWLDIHFQGTATFGASDTKYTIPITILQREDWPFRYYPRTFKVVLLSATVRHYIIISLLVYRLCWWRISCCAYASCYACMPLCSALKVNFLAWWNSCFITRFAPSLFLEWKHLSSNFHAKTHFSPSSAHSPFIQCIIMHLL
jgi:hypothetical protein